MATTWTEPHLTTNCYSSVHTLYWHDYSRYRYNDDSYVGSTTLNCWNWSGLYIFHVRPATILCDGRHHMGLSWHVMLIYHKTGGMPYMMSYIGNDVFQRSRPKSQLIIWRCCQDALWQKIAPELQSTENTVWRTPLEVDVQFDIIWWLDAGIAR